MWHYLSPNIAFAIVGFAAASYQALSQFVKAIHSYSESVRADFGYGFSSQDLNESNVEETSAADVADDVKLHLASGALCVLNAYANMTAKSNPVDTVITCGILAKTTFDLARRMR